MYWTDRVQKSGTFWKSFLQKNDYCWIFQFKVIHGRIISQHRWTSPHWLIRWVSFFFEPKSNLLRGVHRLTALTLYIPSYLLPSAGAYFECLANLLLLTCNMMDEKNPQKLIRTRIDYEKSLFLVTPSSETRETDKWPRAWLKAGDGRAALVSRVSWCPSFTKSEEKLSRDCSQSSMRMDTGETGSLA